MTHTARAIFALIACSLSLAACEGVTGGSSGNPIGVGGVGARTKGAGYTMGPQISFYRVTGATFITSMGARDTCFLTSYSAPTTPTTSTAPKLSAGAIITMATGTRTDTLTRGTGGTDQTYRSPLTSGIPFTPGDSMVISVAGDVNGFPISTFRGKTAEPFVLNPPTLPSGAGPITITWTPAQDLNAAMFVNFRYLAGTATTLNRQIACTFADDGSGTVPATVTADWLAATTRDYTAERIRTILATVPVPLSYFNIVSSFNWPTPVSP